MREQQVSSWLRWLLLAVVLHAAGASAAELKPFTTREELRAYLFELNQAPKGIGTAYVGSCSTYSPLREAAAAQRGRLSVQVSGELILLLYAGRLFSVSLVNDDLRVVEALTVGDSPDGMLRYGNRLFIVSDRVKRRLDVIRFDADGRLTPDGSYRWDIGYGLGGWQVVGTQLLAIGSQHNFVGQAGAEKVPEQALPTLEAEGQLNNQSSLPRVYRPVHRAPQLVHGSSLLTLLRCDLSDPAPKAGLACETTALPGIWENMQLTPTAAYLVGLDAAPGRSVLYRVPADGAAPRAVQIRGAPVAGGLWEHQGFVNLVLKSQAESPDSTLLRLPLAAFGDGTQQANAMYYTTLPALAGRQVHIMDQDLVLEPFEARCPPVWSIFTREGALLGEARVPPEVLGAPRTDDRPQLLTIARRNGGLATEVIALPPIDSVFSHDAWLMVNVSRYAGQRVLGLPLLDFRTPQPSAALGFSSLTERGLQELGSLQAQLPRECDRCEWRYRNAQPIFVGARWFAFIGDELIEGTLKEGRLTERRRIGLSR